MTGSEEQYNNNNNHALANYPMMLEQLQFSSQFSHADFKLFQLPDDLLSEIESGNITDLYIKAANDPNQPVILCTNNRTFNVVSVDTSNTVLLRNKSHPSRSNKIQASVSCIYEITEKPSSSMYSTLESQIRRLLSRSPFFGGLDYEEIEHSDDDEADYEEDEDMDGGEAATIRKNVKKTQYFSSEDLEKYLLASKAEIHNVLQQMPVIQVNQYWRLIDPTKYDEYCSLFFLTVQAEGWKLDNIPAEHCLRLLKEEGHDSLLAHHCILAFRDKSIVHTSGNIGLDIKKITVHYGKNLLQQKTRWLRDDFALELQNKMADICSLIKTNSTTGNEPAKPQIGYLIKNGIAKEETSPTDNKQYIVKC